MKTKLITAFATVVAAVLGMAACADDNQEARTPQALLTASSQRLEINESMALRFTGTADQVVVFTGDKGHVYELRDSSNTGFTVNKGLFTYSYATPGTFHVVCVATTYDTYMGASLRSDTTGFYVTVTDDVTTISAISATVTPNIYYARLVNDADWVMCLPTKQLYNNREMTVNAARQRLEFAIASDSASIYIDDTPYSTRDYYDLNGRHAIRVVSGSGTVRDYSLYGLVYPEFSSIAVDGQMPTLVRSAYYQDLLTYQVPAASGLLTFTVDDDVQLLADGVAVVSGTPLNPQADYTLRRTLSGHPEVTATTRVRFE